VLLQVGIICLISLVMESILFLHSKLLKSGKDIYQSMKFGKTIEVIRRLDRKTLNHAIKNISIHHNWSL